MIAFYLAAVVAGALVALQTGSNARLKEALGEPIPAVIVSSALGITVLIAVVVAARIPLPSFQQLAAAPWSAWLGGVLGALYAVTVVLLARRPRRRDPGGGRGHRSARVLRRARPLRADRLRAACSGDGEDPWLAC